ncbi:MAG: CCA tRNA nucleotidyltransferase, partial [Parachlamydiaceae bacterium]
MDAFEQGKRIVRILNEEGYKAYFAGGWVRDYLLSHPSNDIDIATDCPMPKLLDLFPNALLVGMQFGVIVLPIDGHLFEIATFRRDIEYQDGRKPLKIESATPEEDALRRDFTINGMFYDPLENKIYDYVQGIQDLKKGVIRAIGDPYERFQEDRLRMIRAVRFSSRFGYPIDQETKDAIIAFAPELFPAVATERIYQELKKMAESARFKLALHDLYDLKLLEEIIPSLKNVHKHDFEKRISRIDETLPFA